MFTTELVVTESSAAIGQTLRELQLHGRFRLSPVGVIRGAARLSEEALDTPLLAADVVVVEGEARAINRGARAAGLLRKRSTKAPLPAGAPTMVEATVSYNSPLIGHTLAQIDMRGRYGLDVMALWRRGGSIVEKIGRIRLRLGDDLLISGPLEKIRQLAGDPLYLLLDDNVLPRYEAKKEFLSLLSFSIAIVAGMTGLVDIPVAFLCGAIAVVTLRCLSVEEAYRALNLKLIVLIGSMIGVSLAIEQSGTASWLASNLIEFAGGDAASPLILMAGMYWMTVLLTQSMSNAAAALLVAPVAFSAATMLGLDGRPFAITVAVAASLAFMTPLEPACLLVMSTGRYKFRDFLRFGAPLTLMCFLLVMLLVPLIFM